jgi:hypothetical protein
MTTAQSDFITDILVEYTKQAELERDSAFISRDDQMPRRYKFLLKRLYAHMIIDYFNVFSLDDSNFCTEEEIQLIIDRFNQLCNTDYSVDVTITDTDDAAEHVWDDSLYWDDTDTWED